MENTDDEANGTGWDNLRQTIEMDPEWWRNIKAVSV